MNHRLFQQRHLTPDSEAKQGEKEEWVGRAFPCLVSCRVLLIVFENYNIDGIGGSRLPIECI